MERDRHVVAEAGEISEGDVLLTLVDGMEIAVYYLDGEYYAYANWCPHQGGPVCEGKIGGTRTATFDRESLSTEYEWVKEGKLLSCPWHWWQFDIKTGECISRNIKLISYEVTVNDGDIIVQI
jgi:nitrite reductase/ring-hydroxylating ferredoxin subunit